MRRSKRKASHNTATAAAAVPTVFHFACKRVCKTWRDLTLEPYFAKLHLPRSPLRLVFYRHGVKNYSWFICYFDIQKEQFGCFPLPSHIGGGCRYLEVADNRLFLYNCHSFYVWKFWAMNDYGDFGSWTLEWVIAVPITFGFQGIVRPLKILKDGTLLMMFNSSSSQTKAAKATLASYNPET
ncbi:hypothetical protein RHMOL_Rhmol04G0066300 [Rhododendron molle]|uniref:Uncharacterized protein n=1 Tax=Rhododendron molle TaxID=49168 RepID=A0ACC0NXT8_RHOML|nr:hypothetical protein RHMOL_Rhmol04G0066300 [Rhododendron molle]